MVIKKIIPCPNEPNEKVLLCELKSDKCKNILLVIVYRPPSGNVQQYYCMLLFLDLLTNRLFNCYKLEIHCELI